MNLTQYQVNLFCERSAQQAVQLCIYLDIYLVDLVLKDGVYIQCCLVFVLKFCLSFLLLKVVLSSCI